MSGEENKGGQASNSSSWEAEAGALGAYSQPGLHSGFEDCLQETLSPKVRKGKKQGKNMANMASVSLTRDWREFPVFCPEATSALTFRTSYRNKP